MRLGAPRFPAYTSKVTSTSRYASLESSSECLGILNHLERLPKVFRLHVDAKIFPIDRDFVGVEIHFQFFIRRPARIEHLLRRCLYAHLSFLFSLFAES